MKPLLINQSRDRVSRAWIERWLKGLARILNRRGYALSRKEIVMVFVASGEIRRLNRLYRRKDYSTDILSFQPADDSSLGELVLCLPVIRQQCKRTGLSERGELGYMIVHGVLHLLGYDHEKPAAQVEMFSLQDEIYARLAKSVGFR